MSAGRTRSPRLGIVALKLLLGTYENLCIIPIKRFVGKYLCLSHIFEGNPARILSYYTVSIAVTNKGRMPYQNHDF